MVQFKRSVCPHDCPDTCGLLVGVENSRVLSVRGDPEHPFTRGAVCTKVRHYPERVHSPSRLLHPMKRTGPKGQGQIRTHLLGAGLHRDCLPLQTDYFPIRVRSHPALFLCRDHGLVHFHAGHPFFHKLGASRLLRTICGSAAQAGFAASMGDIPTTDIETSVKSDLILIWGSNTLSTNLHAWPFLPGGAPTGRLDRGHRSIQKPYGGKSGFPSQTTAGNGCGPCPGHHACPHPGRAH